VRFLIDTQLPRLLARRLQDAGHEAVHVLDLSLAQCPDNDLWHHARDHDMVIVTKDEDFAEWVLAGRHGPSVVWLRIGNCTNIELVAWLLPQWSHVAEALQSGECLVEIV
jgi:predicted nuclease of predicted toxin-antitoxin system